MAGLPRHSDPEVLARIKNLGLRARFAVQGTMVGANRSPQLGQSVEFADYREYAPGDDPKRLDWRSYARSDRFFVKLYEEESNLRAHCILDASRSMAYRSGAMTKYDWAATLVASLSTLLIEQRDAVGLLLCDEIERRYLAPRAGSQQLVRLLAELEAGRPERSTELGAVLARKIEEIPRRGVVIVVSDFLCDLDSVFAAVERLRDRGHEAVNFHVLDRDEIELPFDGQVEFRGLEDSGRVLAEPRYFREVYRQAMQTFIGDVRARSARAGADYLLCRTDHGLGEALALWLARRERRRDRKGHGALRFARRSRGGGR